MGRAGIGPATLGLKGPCSTTELSTRAKEASDSASLAFDLRARMDNGPAVLDPRERECIRHIPSDQDHENGLDTLFLISTSSLYYSYSLNHYFQRKRMNDIGTCISCGAEDVELNENEQCTSCSAESAERGPDMGIEEES